MSHLASAAAASPASPYESIPYIFSKCPGERRDQAIRQVFVELLDTGRLGEIKQLEDNRIIGQRMRELGLEVPAAARHPMVAFKLALEGGRSHEEMRESVLRMGFYGARVAMMDAVARGDVDTVGLLMTHHQANEFVADALLQAAEKGQAVAARVLLRDTNSHELIERSLLTAARAGNFDVVEELLEAGAAKLSLAATRAIVPALIAGQNHMVELLVKKVALDNRQIRDIFREVIGVAKLETIDFFIDRLQDLPDATKVEIKRIIRSYREIVATERVCDLLKALA
jgi:hypothetical protein